MLRNGILLGCLWGVVAGRALGRTVVPWMGDRRRTGDYRQAWQALERLNSSAAVEDGRRGACGARPGATRRRMGRAATKAVW